MKTSLARKIVYALHAQGMEQEADAFLQSYLDTVNKKSESLPPLEQYENYILPVHEEKPDDQCDPIDPPEDGNYKKGVWYKNTGKPPEKLSSETIIDAFFNNKQKTGKVIAWYWRIDGIETDDIVKWRIPE